MPQKRGKKTKGRKAKGFDSSQQGKQDEITGLTLDFKDVGGVIVSDQTYGINSPIGKFAAESTRSYQGRNIVDCTFEYELSSQDIVFTALVKYDQPDGPGNYDALTRVVFQGNFKYSEGVLKEATISSVAQSWPDKVGLGGILYKSPTGGTKVTDPSSWQSFASATGLITSVENKVAQYLDYDQDGSNDDDVIGGGEQAIRDFGGGRFFYENWWTNPFNSNLV